MKGLRSVGAVLAGGTVNVVLAIATDRAMVAIGLYPPEGGWRSRPECRELSVGSDFPMSAPIWGASIPKEQR
jgi:hypothetical protein